MEELTPTTLPAVRSERVTSTCYKTVNCFHESIPFSHMDKDTVVEKRYSDGRKTTLVRPKSRYSDSMSKFNEVATRFGYKFLKYNQKSVALEGEFIFLPDDTRLPSIYVSPTYTYASDDCFIIKMPGGEPHFKLTECNCTLKTHQDCFSLIYKKLHYAFKFSEFEDIKKKLALLNIKNKLQINEPSRFKRVN